MLGITGVVTFEALTVAAAIEEFRASVDEYLSFCAKLGQDPAKPYSGTIDMHVIPEQHRGLELAAIRAGMSLETWASEVVTMPVRSRGIEG